MTKTLHQSHQPATNSVVYSTDPSGLVRIALAEYIPAKGKFHPYWRVSVLPQNNYKRWREWDQAIGKLRLSSLASCGYIALAYWNDQ